MTTSPVHRQPLLTALLLSMVASMGDHQGHSALPTAGARCECFRWMRVGDGRCPNSFRATGDNSTAYAGSFGDYNTATASESDDGGDSLDRMLLEIANGDAVRVALACAVETVMHTRERYGSHTGAALTVRAARQMGSKLNAIACASRSRSNWPTPKDHGAASGGPSSCPRRMSCQSAAATRGCSC